MNTPAGPSKPRPPAWAIALAFGVVYLTWGTTYLAIKVGVHDEALPPALFGGQHAFAVIVFAGLADGERRARIESWRDGGKITISREGWNAAPQEKGQAPPPTPPAMHCSSQV